MLMTINFFHFTERVPSVLLVLEGGTGTIDTVYEACQNCIPVVLIKGSGRATDVLAYAHENLFQGFSHDCQETHEGLISISKEKFPKLPLNKVKDLCEKIRGCMEQSKYVSWLIKFCCEVFII